MIILATCIFFCVAAKSDALRCLQEVYHEIFRDTWNHLQIFRTDGGGEFTSKRFEEYLSQQGVRHEITAPYCPEQNGFCGRDNRTIMEGVRSLLHTNGFPPTFWAEACHTVVYTLNRTGSRMIPGNTPFTLWHGFKPSLEHLRIFGCHAYAYVEKHQRTKLDPKSHLCYFLGYCDNTKGYRLWDPATSQILLRRDVISMNSSFTGARWSLLFQPLMIHRLTFLFLFMIPLLLLQIISLPLTPILSHLRLPYLLSPNFQVLPSCLRLSIRLSVPLLHLPVSLPSLQAH